MAEKSGGLAADNSFGPKRPPLYELIKNILREYPCGQIFKEIIQNADDAGATEVKFFLDCRNLSSLPLSLNTSHHEKFTGPALLSYNNASFSREDWDSIQSLQCSVKATNPYKVGKFGIGFNSVYHITDLPIILSQNYCGFLEPQEEVWEGESGKGFYLQAINTKCPDVLTPFHDICGFVKGTQYFNGTFLRFPLRASPSKLSRNVYSIQKLRELIQALKDEAKFLLLFLRSVCSIEVLEITEETLLNPQCLFKVCVGSTYLQEIQQQKKQFLKNIKLHSSTYSDGFFINDIATFNIDIHDDGACMSHDWIIVNQVGSNEADILKLAQQQYVLPWVGAAFEIVKSIDPFDTMDLGDCSGRIFCVLPLPVEDTVPMSVHINGTFAISSDRRSLKWASHERINDNESEWNKMLVEKCLPTCLIELFTQLVKLSSNNPSMVYDSLPEIARVSHTPWSGMLKPFYSCLFNNNKVMLCVTQNVWIDVSEGVYIEHDNLIPEPVKEAMGLSGVKLVELSENLEKALKEYYNGNITTLNPAIVRSQLKSNVYLYKNMSYDNKLEILTYCLSDYRYCDLEGLELLPVVDKSFKIFENAYLNRCNIYICSKAVPSSLLPQLKHLLISVYENDEQLHESLLQVASYGHTQIKKLTGPIVARLLLHCDTSLWSQDQLAHFWQWLSKNRLDSFFNRRIVPVKLPSGEIVIKSLAKTDGIVYIPFLFYYHSQVCLISGLQKLGIKFADARCFNYLTHKQLNSYLYQFVPNDVLDALNGLEYMPPVELTKEEASALQNFFSASDYMQQKHRVSTVSSLSIFSVIQSNALFSINHIKTLDDKAVCIRLNALSKFFLPDYPLVLDNNTSCNNSLLLSSLSSVHCMSEIDYILQIAFCQIRNKRFTGERANDFMKNVLDLVTTYRSSTRLTSALTTLPFINTGGSYCAPCDLYDPKCDLLRELFQDQPKFPPSEFHPYLFILRKYCGLKSLESVTMTDIISVIDSMKQRPSDYNKAKAILSYFKKFSISIYSSIIIKNKSQTCCWLPVVNTPSSNYLTCLNWKGSLLRQPALVSSACKFAPIVCLTGNIESSQLPMICGSQVLFIENVPIEIASDLSSSPSAITEAIASHFKCIIKNKNEISLDVLENLVIETYNYLQNNMDTIELNTFRLTDRCIWLDQCSSFVSPDKAAIKPYPSFGPYSLEPVFYVISPRWQKYSCLFAKLGVAQEMNLKHIVSVLNMIKDDPTITTSEQAWLIVKTILEWLAEDSSRLDQAENVLVPVANAIDSYPCLLPANEVFYNSYDMLCDIPLDEEYHLIHSKVAHLALPLKLTSLSDHLGITQDIFDDAGQHEPLTIRLKNILKEYKDGLTIIKEMIQNADDAEATEVNILYDSRHHTVTNTFIKGMAECHGPALIVHNNSTFKDEDFANITKLAGATKSDKPLKIGKFGLGFCSVYHMTDVPSFVSGEWLFIFDPTLKHLKGAIQNENQPGKKVKFTVSAVLRSNLLAPYKNLFDFIPDRAYKGTMFRLPFRTHSSEISSIVYNNHMIEQLKLDLIQNGSKLLLFLQNVKRITFKSIVDEYDGHDDELSIECIGNGDIKCIKFSRFNSIDEVEYWLLSSSQDILYTLAGIPQPGIASVACQLSWVDNGLFECKKIEGNVFCFLPLPTFDTGLPVHVNGNFVVLSNRSYISTTSDRSDSMEYWNRTLIEKLVSKAYCDLLIKLKEMCLSGKLKSYKFYTLWPLDSELKIKNPWMTLTTKLYNLLSKEALFYSKSTSQWLKLEKCRFLESSLFAPGEALLNDDGACINKAAIQLRLPVISFAQTYLEQLQAYGYVQSKHLIDQKLFANKFLFNIVIFENDYKSRNQVLLHILSWISTGKLSLTNVLIPCSPDGVKLKRPSELLNPIVCGDMFDPNQEMFPLSSFTEKYFILETMIDLGLLQTNNIPFHIIAKCAKTVKSLYSYDEPRAFKRIKKLLNCISQNQSSICDELKNIPFIPVLPKPSKYILPWKGDACNISSLSQVIAPKSDDLLQEYSLIVGSQKLIVDISTCGTISQEILSILNIPTTPLVAEVLAHFQLLINKEVYKENIEMIGIISANVYKYLNSHMSDLSEMFAEYNNVPFIWTGELFVPPCDIAKYWKCNGPFLYKLPDSISGCIELLKALKVNDKFDARKLLNTFRKLNESNSISSLNCPKLCDEIIEGLNTVTLNDDDKDEDIFLVDKNYKLKLATELVYNDAEWYQTDDDDYVHEKLSREKAKEFQLILSSTKYMKNLESASQNFAGSSFGQNEKLTDRIRNILRNYPLDVTLMKEFIQNADDAKATKMYVILDSREHGTDRVLSEDWKELQGPALLVWNDKDFTDEDLKGIQELGVGSKRDDSGSIGQFGIGFNVVYNVTDCPSFITQGNILCVFDPHCRYVPGADHTKPGRQYTLDQSFWSNMSDLRTAYLLDDVPNKPLGLESGVLFRFPLRCTDKLVNDSELVDSETQVLTADKVKKLLHEWIFLIKDSLLFLNNLTQFEVFAIDDKQKGFEKLFSFSVCLTNEDQKQRSNVIEKYKNSKVCSKVVYQLTLKTNELEEHWLILQGVGNLNDPGKQWIFPKSIPKHGIAAPLSKQEHFNGKVFCFLPLPEDTDLPVHINGQFILSSDRRSIWHCSSDDDSDNKAKWNSDLIKAIAYSYALFLCDARGYYINSKGYQNLAKFYDAINCYYDLFPFWNPPFNSLPEQQSVSSSDVEIQSEHKLKNNWHNINEMVFESLWSNNSPILASKVRISKSQKVTWHVLKELDLHDQAYFDSQNMTNEALSTHDELKLVLRDIGMTLTCAPDTLYMHLKKFKPEPAIINRESVFKYYRMFYHLKINKCPCPLNTTPFKSVKNFCLFYKFLLAMDTSDQNNIHYIFPASPVDLPLLLTNDLQLRTFTKFAIKSNFCHLFKNTSDKFLHSSVLAVCPQVSSSYFFTKDDTSIKGTVVEIMKNNYKALCCEKFIYSNHEDINSELLKELWKCLHKDPIFHCHEKAIVQLYALIPADKQILFRNSSPILPIINPLEQKQLCDSEESEQYKKYYEMFVSMGIPSFNSSVSEYALKYCLDLSKHFIRVLSTVCHLNHQQNLHLYLPGLFDYFGKIDFRHNSKSVQQIKSLPLFKTLHDKWTKIDKKALYTMSSELCDAGFEKWAPFDKVVILKERGDWRMLCDKIETLGGERLSERNIYLKLIFPKFSELSKDEQKLHLKFIRDKVYPHVKADIDHGHDGGRYVNAALLFKRQLEDLKCIESTNGNLKTIKSYCHHEIKIFSLFQENEEFELIPEEYREKKDGWMDFLCDLGLQKKIELSKFKKYCRDVSLGVLSNINDVSEVLVEYLFSESAEEWHDDSEILSEIGNICFVQVHSLDNLQMIADSCKVENDLTSLKGSVIDKWAEIIWTVKPVVSLPIDETHELYNKILENLSVIIKPSVNDVYENITKISKTDLAEFGNFSKYEMSRGCILPSVESVIKKSLQYMFEEGENDLLEKLSNVPCIPVSAVHKSDNYPVLVKPLQVVRYIPDECKCLFPYIHNLPSFMNTIDGDLKLLGISDNITVKMLKTMLQFIYEKNKDLRDPNISIQVRTAILKIEELFSASNNAVSSDTAPLYLPNDQHKLVDSSQLVYIDAHRYRVNLEVMRFHGLLFQLPPAILNSSSVTTSNAYCSDEQRVCLQLPKCIRPNGLSFVCTEEVLKVNECESSRCQFFSHLQNFKCLVPFLKEELLKNKGFGNEYDDKLLFLVDFIMEMELKVVSFLECNVRIDEEIVGIIQVQYSLQHLRCKQCVLYIESNASLSPFMREMLAHTLCVEAIRRHHIQDEICLSKYVELVSQFLQIQIREDINSIFGSTINVRRDHIPKPDAQIPNELLDVLIQGNDSHIFNEGEWVGYLIGGVFVFATVVGPIIDELGNVIKYKIHINESEQEVSVSDIYKFEFGDNSVLTQPVPTPPNPEEAKRWFRQAKSDETVMNILLEQAQENSECWCHVLFLAQQVCEKALKAGMYKLVGLDNYDLRTHKLDFFVNTLTAKCELTQDQLYNKVFSFNNYYISSRYPNAHSLPNAPVDVYSTCINQRTCRQAASNASKVLDLIGILSNFN